MSADFNRPFPRGPLVGAALLVGFTILVAGGGRLMGTADAQPTAAPLAARDLRFEDRDDGGVAVLDAAADRDVAVMAPGTNGFLRSTLRGLVRERKRQDVGPEVPFRLTAWADGRLTLQDPATHRLVDLGAFGITNAGTFARLLTDAEAPR